MLVEQVEALKSIQEAYVAMNSEQLDEGFAHPNHKKLDANGNGKVDAHDFELLRKKKGIKNFKEFKEEIEGLDEGTNIPVRHATDAVSKVMGQKGAVNFLAKLKPGNKTHTSWNEVNSALADQGAQSAHIAKVAGHLKPTKYDESED